MLVSVHDDVAGTDETDQGISGCAPEIIVQFAGSFPEDGYVAADGVHHDIL